MKLLSRPIFGATAVFITALVIYLQTMARGLGFIDAGELATVCNTLGIAHPTGYPLFTLIGAVFAKLPIAEHVITRLNIMSVFFSALGAGAVVFLTHEIHLHWLRARQKYTAAKDKKKAVPKTHQTADETTSSQATAVGIFAGLIIAFSETWWMNSTSIEVYPIHQFFLPTVLIFFLRYLRTDANRDGMLFALCLGLAFSNHLTTILLAPACLYGFFATFGFSHTSWKRIGKLVLPFLLGLLPYVYLPIRSASFPLLDWGHPASLGSFLKHVTGGQYKVWMFTDGAASEQWEYFWSGLGGEFSLLLCVIAAVAILLSFKFRTVSRLHIGMFLFLLFFGCLLYAINYKIHDIDSYFLLSYLSITLAASLILSPIVVKTATMKHEGFIYLALGAGIALAGMQFVGKYKTNDESGNRMVDDFTTNMLTNLPKDAIVFSSAWDFWVSGSFYYQFVEKLRPDVTVIDVALLRDRPWYYEHIRQIAPDILKNCQTELDVFYPHLVAFDKGESYDAGAISSAYKNFTDALVRNNQHRPIFITPELLTERDDLFAASFKPFATGIAFRLSGRDTVFDITIPKLVWDDTQYRSKRNYYTDNARVLQATPIAESAIAATKRGEMDKAKKLLELALRLKPDTDIDLDELSQRDADFAARVNAQFLQWDQLRLQLK